MKKFKADLGNGAPSLEFDTLEEAQAYLVGVFPDYLPSGDSYFTTTDKGWEQIQGQGQPYSLGGADLTEYECMYAPCITEYEF